MKMMKKISRCFIFLIIVSILTPKNILALSTGYIDIQDNNKNVLDNKEGIRFEKISFRKNNNSTNQTFGLEGIIYNDNKYNIIINVASIFYDLNYNVITTTNTELSVLSGKYNHYSNLLNIDEVNNTEDIAYYTLDIDVVKEQSSNIDTSNEQHSNYEYILNGYNINVNVNENNTFDITENISAYLNAHKHGIFRKIPLRNKVTRLDGTISNNRAKISNINVNEEYTQYNKNGYKTIKIGDPNITLTGQKNYTISYLYNIGKDTGKKYDEFYFNLIGDEWDTIIDNVTFTITMPKEFDESKLGFSSGPKGSTDSSRVTYTVNGNTITGRLHGILNPSEALTIRLELPEGYFVGASDNFDYTTIIYITLPILFVIISYLMWRKYGKDNQVIETVEFYSPEGFNSLEIGFLYKGIATKEDAISLLIYLANKGYIKISEYEEKSLFSKIPSFKLTKLKEYDGDNSNERIFLNGLFKNKKTTHAKDTEKIEDSVNEVTAYDLKNEFYITLNEIIKNINNKDNRHKIFEKPSISIYKNILIVLMIIATYCLITIPPMIFYGDTTMIIHGLFFSGIGFTWPFMTLINKNQRIYVNGKPTKSIVSIIIFAIVFLVIFGGIPFALIVLPALLQDLMYLIIYIVGLLCVLCLIILKKYLPKRTPYGNEMLGKIKGFKNYLETVKKDKLEAMVMDNPSYFYDILPYTYVLGVSDKWIEKFESISLKTPTWYNGRIKDMNSFYVFLNNTMSSAHSSMSSSPSGGGSAGGGSGGGGGGSW